MPGWLLLLAGLLLIAANGVFVAAESSLVSVDRTAVERAAREGDGGASSVLTALRSLSTQLSGAQLGITVTSLAVGFLVEPSLGELLRGPLVHAKDLAATDRYEPGDPLPAGLVRPLATVTADSRLHDVLVTMQARGSHLGRVEDDQGRTHHGATGVLQGRQARTARAGPL